MSTDKEREPKRRTRHIDAKDIYVPEGRETEMHSVFRKRLTYLMNGNNPMGKTVNIQELADAVDVSRPAIRKYLKPKDHKEPTTPSALTVCKIARYFGTTPNFLLGFDEPVEESMRLGYESDFYNRLGLNQNTISKLCELRAKRSDDEKAAALLSMLDKQICAFTDDALNLLKQK